jgi:hypothetical protein
MSRGVPPARLQLFTFQQLVGSISRRATLLQLIAGHGGVKVEVVMAARI